MNKKFMASALCASMVLSMGAAGQAMATSETTAPAEETTAAAAASADVLTPDQLKAIAEEGMTTSIEAEPMELSLACSGTIDGTIMGDAVDAAIEAVSRWTNGSMKVNFYPGGQLGGDTELIASAQSGSIDMFQGAPTSQVTLIPELSVLDIGGLFADVEACNTVLTNMYDKFEAAYNAKGLTLRGLYAPDFRILSSNKPVTNADELKGLNIRVQENEYHIAFWKQLGCNPTPLAFGELYIALQQGMMDAQENPPASIVGAKICEVQKYIVKTNHIPFVNTFVMNKAKYDAMSDNQKLVVDQFTKYMEKYQMAGTAQDDQRMLDLCASDYGIEVTEASDELRQLFQPASQAVIDLMKQNGVVDSAFIDEYVAAAQAAAK